MRVIGITGPTGAGKTTVLQALESLGGVLIDADAVYHDLTRSSQAMQAELIARFGPVYDGNELDRKKLGAVVFQDENALADLNRITHKYIARETQRRIEAAKAAGATAVGIDAIGLLESQLVDFCDCTLAVTAPEELRVKRIMARDGISEDYARLRVSAQKPSAWFQAHCDYTIESTEADTVETTGARAKALFEKILEVNQKDPGPAEAGRPVFQPHQRLRPSGGRRGAGHSGLLRGLQDLPGRRQDRAGVRDLHHRPGGSRRVPAPGSGREAPGR